MIEKNKNFLFRYVSKLIDGDIDEIETLTINGMTFEEAMGIFNQLNIENFGYDVYEFSNVPVYSSNENKWEKTNK